MTTVWAVYFSGTGTTERTVTHIAGELARLLAAPCRSLDFTRPQVRQQELDFCQSNAGIRRAGAQCAAAVPAGKGPGRGSAGGAGGAVRQPEL